MSFVLGVGGLAGSGKDTIADFLIEQRGWAGKISFARNLKDMVKHAFKLSEYQVSDHEGKKSKFKNPIVLDNTHIGAVLVWMCRTHTSLAGGESDKERVRQFLRDIVGTTFNTPRDILQFVGTDFCRTLVPTYHVDIVRQKLLQSDGNWIITDVRFLNEAELVKALNGFLVRIERPSLSRSDTHRHESETALSSWDGWDKILINDAPTIEDLYSIVDKFLEESDLCRKTTP